MTCYDLCQRHRLKEHIGVLPGWTWLKEHEHDLDGWTPSFEMHLGNLHYNVTVKDPKTLRDIVKANH